MVDLPPGRDIEGIPGLRFYSPGAEAGDRHPELFHYTKLEGFKAIIASGSLWATEYRSLNDSSEIRFSKGALAEPIAQHLESYLKAKQRTKFSVRRRVQAMGGLHDAATKLGGAVVSLLHRCIFQESVGSEYSPPAMAVPFITSFCSHSSDDAYTNENGLLSQWRAYGGAGGVCIVFDSKRILQLIADESRAYFWGFIGLNEVTYFDSAFGPQKAGREILHFCERIAEFLLAGAPMNGTHPEWAIDSSDAFIRFINLTTRLKHPAFREEREVRIVVSPITEQQIESYTDEFRSLFRATQSRQPHMALKQVRNGPNHRRHISLFDGADLRSAIRRLIVGPTSAQDDLYRAAATLRPGIPIARSKTPFIG